MTTNTSDAFYRILGDALSTAPEADRKTLADNAEELAKLPGLHPDIFKLVQTIAHSKPPYLHDPKHKKPPH